MINLPVPMRPISAVPDLSPYSLICVAISGGKDSQQALYQTALECDRQGVPRSRIVAIHADLGDVEWPGVVELAERHAHLCGVRFVKVQRHGRVVCRSGKCYNAGETYGTILDHAERMGFWPKAASRYCTSDHKRDPILRAIRKLARELRTKRRRQALRVLNVMGLRAGESRARAQLQPFTAHDKRSSSATLSVDRWYPIFGWSVNDVWRAVWESGHPWHAAYDWGLPRLSCTLCVLASKPALRLGAFLQPGLARSYARVECAIGRTLQKDFSIGAVSEEIDAIDTPADLVAYARKHGPEVVGTWEG